MAQLGQVVKPIALVTVCIGALYGSSGAIAADIAQEAILAWNSHDPAKVAAMFTEDAIYEDTTLGVVNHGTADIRKFAKQFFDESPDGKFTVTSSFMEDGHGYAEWVMTGTDVGMFKTNKRYQVRGASIVQGSPEKLTHQTDYWDMATLMKQLGVLPEPPK